MNMDYNVGKSLKQYNVHDGCQPQEFFIEQTRKINFVGKKLWSSVYATLIFCLGEIYTFYTFW